MMWAYPSELVFPPSPYALSFKPRVLIELFSSSLALLTKLRWKIMDKALTTFKHRIQETSQNGISKGALSPCRKDTSTIMQLEDRKGWRSRGDKPIK